MIKNREAARVHFHRKFCEWVIEGKPFERVLVSTAEYALLDELDLLHDEGIIRSSALADWFQDQIRKEGLRRLDDRYGWLDKEEEDEKAKERR